MYRASLFCLKSLMATSNLTDRFFDGAFTLHMKLRQYYLCSRENKMYE